MKRRLKEQTLIGDEGLELADYAYRNFEYLQSSFVDLSPTSTVGSIIQKYLNDNIDRVAENRLTGIIAIQDVWPNATGGRVELIAGLTGPFVEAVQSSNIPYPVDYEVKDKAFKKALRVASDDKTPFVGKIHFHLWHANTPKVSMFDVLEFLRTEHGSQNEVKQKANIVPYLFIPRAAGSFWRPADSGIVNAILRKPE